MKTSFKVLLAAIILVMAACSGKGDVEVAAGPGVTGTWLMAVDATSGPGTPILGLTQNGEEITGRYKGALGIVPLTGTIKGNDITMVFEGHSPDGLVNVKYTGKVNGNSMSGDVSMDPIGKGTFEGTKQ